MTYLQDISRALPTRAGGDEDLSLWHKLQLAAMETVTGLRDNLKPFLSVVTQPHDVDAVLPLAQEIREQFEHIVLVGTGGSSLGAKTLASLAEGRPNTPTLHMLENVDPYTTQQVLERINPARTCCLLISKSGTTVEVLANAHVLLAHFLQAVGREAIARQFVVITEPKPSPLREIAEYFNMRTLVHDPKIGGRYSAFSLVGLLPAAALGLDIEAFRKGAASMLQQTLDTTSTIGDSYPAMGAALQTYHMLQGKPIHVLMPYCDRLRTFSYWYRQLVAESLGKEHTGITPLASFGAVDQHSMLQLYNDGQADKQFTFITLEDAGKGPVISPLENIRSLPHLMHKTIGDMMMAMHHGTIHSIANHGHPLRVLHLQQLDETTLGALMMHFALETVISGGIMEIDPFDQPAVEESKRLAREYLERVA